MNQNIDMMNEIKDIKNYIESDYDDVPYTTKQILDMLNDKSINREQMKGLKRSLIFDLKINLAKMMQDHQWYINQLNKNDKEIVKAVPKAAPKAVPKAAPKTALKPLYENTKESDLKDISRSELIAIINQQNKIINELNKKPTQSSMMTVKDGWIRNPNTNRLIKVNNSTYKKLYPASKPIKVKEETIPVPTPRKTVKQMAKEYEDNIILPPFEFRDGPVPAPRTIRRPVPLPRSLKPIEKPIPKPRTLIKEINKALKGYAKSFEVYTAVSTKVVQKCVKAYATMPKGSLGNTQ